MRKYLLNIPADTALTDQSFETASWYDKYLLSAGTYAVDMREAHPSSNARILIDATLIETYRVNRLFSASSVATSTPAREQPFPFHINASSIVNGGRYPIGDTVATITEVFE